MRSFLIGVLSAVTLVYILAHTWVLVVSVCILIAYCSIRWDRKQKKKYDWDREDIR